MTNLVAAIILTASWERARDAGQLMANGQPFDPSAMTCACRRFNLGTRLTVTDAQTGNHVTVTVTDRTALRFSDRIDLSPAAFSRLATLSAGLKRVQVRQIF